MITEDNKTGNSTLKPLGYMKLQDMSETLNMDDSCSISTHFITSTPNLKAGKIKQIPLPIDFTIDEVEDDEEDDNIQVLFQQQLMMFAPKLKQTMVTVKQHPFW